LGTRPYLRLPPLPEQSLIKIGPPPFRGDSIIASRSGRTLDPHLDQAVLDEDFEGLHGLVGRKAQRPTGAHVELGAVPRADGDAGLDVEVTLRERPVVMRAAILDRVVVAVQVVDGL
jgi:hypothetical protein